MKICEKYVNKYTLLFVLYVMSSTVARTVSTVSPDENVDNQDCIGSECAHQSQTDKFDEVHSIDIRKLKEMLTVAKNEFDQIRYTIAPIITLDKLFHTYEPMYQSFKNEMMTSYNTQIHPQLQKYNQFASKIYDKFTRRVAIAYDQTNATNVAVPHVKDLLEDIYKEMEPLIQASKYLYPMIKSRFNSDDNTKP